MTCPGLSACGSRKDVSKVLKESVSPRSLLVRVLSSLLLDEQMLALPFFAVRFE